MALPPGTWNEPPFLPAIQEGEVHLWRADIGTTSSAVEQLSASLGDEELSQAQRFRFAVHRDRFIVRRAVLRSVLARYLECDPAAIELERSAFGKPFLAPRHDSDLRFNCSHSENLALLAVTRGRAVGVDLERIRPDFSDHAIPERFFAPREAARLRALPADRQPEAFFDLWVRKEAYVKARGMGLSLALDSFEVPLGDAEPVRLLRTAPDTEEAGRWTMVSLRPAPAYPAALVVEGQACTLHCWNWSGTPGNEDQRFSG